MLNYVSMKDFAKDNDLTVLVGEEYLDSKRVYVSDISRPGLELTGYFDYYPHERIQLFGMTEISFANQLTPDERMTVFTKMCTKSTPVFLISRDLTPPKELVEAAEKNQMPVLISKLPTTRLSSVITDYLDYKLAERQSIHGVLVEIYGTGILLTGNSGIGKSETALELVQRGHRLIADDRVDVFQQDEKTIVGEAPSILKHLLEIRGIGIVDVMNLFGVGAVRQSTPVSLIINLENWDPKASYDRLGSADDYQTIFDVDVPKMTIPVKVGRNLSIIIEVAAMNFRAKNLGFDATKVFENQLTELIEKNKQDNQGDAN